MLHRVESFFDALGIDARERAKAEVLCKAAAARANNMTHLNDYLALSAVLLRFHPKRVFEIGTFLGVTSDFILSLLDDCRVVSIAYVNPRLRPWSRRFNNSNLARHQVGSAVSPANRDRFCQLIGDSHTIDGSALVQDHGPFDMVFIDGDHSAEGVRQDTELARHIIGPSGVICWHDANPKPKYLPVRQFLERDLDVTAMATCDNYEGGIACWPWEEKAVSIGPGSVQ